MVWVPALGRSPDRPCASPTGSSRGGALGASLACSQYAMAFERMLDRIRMWQTRLDHYPKIIYLTLAHFSVLSLSNQSGCRIASARPAHVAAGFIFNHRRRDMSFVQCELYRLAVELRQTEYGHRYNELYAAQQALAWALEPQGCASPYAMITGDRSVPEGQPQPALVHPIPLS